ncbi:hypothetical protein K0M31_015794 [Melipona bicolor]|uniref:Fatty acyl-CoA reductase n=1 Tax=Melipona bicolor TaxID=60889 RepID=A0AA40FEP6_9HYME|nr:hypothetical protein K0M31_015794 [Melipona bicolor]
MRRRRQHIDQLEEKVLKIYPNTYTFSKNLAEQTVSSNSDRLPVAIVRPSIIGASIEEPCPGWVDNIFGVTGIILPVSMDIVKVLSAKKDANVDIVPDFVVDSMICAAWHVTLHPNNNVKVYNCTNNAYPLRWGQMIDTLVQCNRETPMNNVLLYPFCLVIANKHVYNILNIFLHILPAFIVDTFLKLSSRKPIMMKGNKRFNKLIASAYYFSTHEWTFYRDNISKMMVDVETLKDSEVVKLNRCMDWKKYIASYTAGIEKFILKEKSKSIDARRRRLSVLCWIHQITQVLAITLSLAIVSYIIC